MAELGSASPAGGLCLGCGPGSQLGGMPRSPCRAERRPGFSTASPAVPRVRPAPSAPPRASRDVSATPPPPPPPAGCPADAASAPVPPARTSPSARPSSSLARGTGATGVGGRGHAARHAAFSRAQSSMHASSSAPEATAAEVDAEAGDGPRQPEGSPATPGGASGTQWTTLLSSAGGRAAGGHATWARHGRSPASTRASHELARAALGGARPRALQRPAPASAPAGVPRRGQGADYAPGPGDAEVLSRPPRQPLRPSEVRSVFGYSVGLERSYEMGRELGRGSFGTVRVARELATGEEYAVKSIPKTPRKGACTPRYLLKLQSEVDAMQQLGVSLDAVYLRDVYEDSQHVHLVMELCSGGSVLDGFRDGAYGEGGTKAVMRAVLRFLAQCHAKGIVYRDVKPENFLLKEPLARAAPRGGSRSAPARLLVTGPIKATDFGLALWRRPRDPPLRARSGTPAYMAPEVIGQRYGHAADVWSAGVMMYQLLTDGCFPFWDDLAGRSLPQIWEDICSHKPDMSRPELSRASPAARALIVALLERDPDRRISAAAALQHPWLEEDERDGLDQPPLRASVLQRLQRFATHGALKQVALRRISVRVQGLLAWDDAAYGARAGSAALARAPPLEPAPTPDLDPTLIEEPPVLRVPALDALQTGTGGLAGAWGEECDEVAPDGRGEDRGSESEGAAPPPPDPELPSFESMYSPPPLVGFAEPQIGGDEIPARFPSSLPETKAEGRATPAHLAHPEPRGVSPPGFARLRQEDLVVDAASRDFMLALKALFDELDSDGSGSVSIAELLRGLNRMGYDVSRGEVSILMSRLDTDGDGLLQISEFAAGLVDWGNVAGHRGQWDGLVDDVFDELDTDHDDVISVDDLRHIMSQRSKAVADGALGTPPGAIEEGGGAAPGAGAGTSPAHAPLRSPPELAPSTLTADARRMLREGDVDGDGVITRLDFHALLEPSAAPDRLSQYSARIRRMATTCVDEDLIAPGSTSVGGRLAGGNAGVGLGEVARRSAETTNGVTGLSASETGSTDLPSTVGSTTGTTLEGSDRGGDESESNERGGETGTDRAGGAVEDSDTPARPDDGLPLVGRPGRNPAMAGRSSDDESTPRIKVSTRTPATVASPPAVPLPPGLIDTRGVARGRSAPRPPPRVPRADVRVEPPRKAPPVAATSTVTIGDPPA